MSRATLQDNSTNVTLFPFLAVLLCTMGSLLLVLVVVSHIARLQATQKAAGPLAKTSDDSQGESPDANRLEAARRYVERMSDVRAQAQDKLRDEQLRLSHIEDHMRRLEDQLQSLRMAAAELNALEEEHDDDQAQASREVDRLQTLISKTREEIDKAKQDSQNRKLSYSIVAYEGRRGTTRRPIYVECRAGEVIFQPEGIRISPEDLSPPLGPGNAVAATLRASREYMMSQGLQPGETYKAGPYPLLIVRPDGIDVFHQVLRAIASWDSDFGYETVDSDWELEFPSADPQLANVMHRAVAEARARQKMLAEAAPRAYRDVVPFDPSGGGRSRSNGYDQGAAAEGGQGTGGRYAQGSSPQDGSVHSPYGSTTAGQTGSLANGAFSGGGSGADSPGRSPGGSGSNPATGQTDRYGLGGDGSNGSREGGAGVAGGPSGQPSQDPGNEPSGSLGLDAESGPRHQRGLASNAGSPTDPLGSPGASGSDATQGSATTGTPGQGTAAGAGSASGGAASAPSGARMSSGSAPSSAVSAEFGNPHQTTSSGSGRGNWKIGKGGATDFPIRRTIQIVVRSDRLVILSEQAAGGAQSSAALSGRQIRLSELQSIPGDELAAALEQHISRWGVAGAGLYWRPVLNLRVSPDGERRAAELAELLSANGIEVRTARSSDIADRSEEHVTW